MSTVKHTPGPWFVNKNMPGWGGLTISRWPEDTYWKDGHVDRIGDCPLATVLEGDRNWENKFPAEANAKLIAAAPEMYEVLVESKRFIETLKEHFPPGDWKQAMNAGVEKMATALAKATT